MTDSANLESLVLLDAGLKTPGQGMDIEAVRQWLEKNLPAVRVQCAEGLGQRTGELIQAAVGNGISRLILGLCSSDYAVVEMQVQARKAGLDPLGVEVVNLRSPVVQCQLQATERAKILLAAAVARARAFAGSKPEHAKLYLSGNLSRRSLLMLSLSEYRAVPSIEQSRCAGLGCRMCVDVCPQAALECSNGRVHHDKSRCEPCGLCITACPRGAIGNPVITPAQLEAEIRALLDLATGRLQPRGIVFTCQRAAEVEGLWHEAWMPVRLPCIGMAPPGWFLAPLLLGASAVGVLPCSGECSIGQDKVIKGRVAYCREFLERIGAPEEMVSLFPLLDEPPAGKGKKAEVDGLFDPHGAASQILLRLAQAFRALPSLVFEHSHSPLGVVNIRQDVCTGCGMCAMSCPTEALAFEQPEDSVSLAFDASLCVACGQCLSKCPEAHSGAIALSKSTDLRRISQGRATLYREETERCAECNAPIASRKMIERIEGLLGSEYATTMPVLSRYCLDCRSTSAFHPIRT